MAEALRMIRFYTVFWDDCNGVPDDKSFSHAEDAEAFYGKLHGPYKRLTVTDDVQDITLKSEIDRAFYE